MFKKTCWKKQSLKYIPRQLRRKFAKICQIQITQNSCVLFPQQKHSQNLRLESTDKVFDGRNRLETKGNSLRRKRQNNLNETRREKKIIENR